MKQFYVTPALEIERVENLDILTGSPEFQNKNDETIFDNEW